jgi:hypothetical protein
MSKYITTINERSTINIYDDHAELILSQGRIVLIDNDSNTIDFVKSRSWTVTNDGAVISNTSKSYSYIGLARHIINAQEGQYVRFRNGNKLDCRINNLETSTSGCNNNKDTLEYEYEIEYDSSNKSAKVKVMGSANCTETVITVDEHIAKDIESGKIHPYARIDRKAIRISLKDEIDYSNLGRYILGLEKGNSKCVHHIDDDRTNLLISNLIALEPSEYTEFKKNRENYMKKVKEEQVISTMNPKGVIDIGKGFFIASIYNEKIEAPENLGIFNSKEEANLAYEKRAREICEELIKDEYESLIANLMAEKFYE